MTSFVLRSLIMAFSMLIAVQLLHGVSYDTFTALVEAGLLFGILSTSIKFFLHTKKIQELIPKQGLFQFLANTLLLLLLPKIVPSFYLNSIATALWGSFVITCVASLMGFNGSKIIGSAPTQKKESSKIKQAKARVIEL